MDAKLKAFLDTIAFSEGTSTSPVTENDGYDVIVTGVDGPSVFTDYSHHPFEFGGAVTVKPGLISTAAGRYQLLARYWRVYKVQLKLSDYSPASQDAVALQQIAERHAIVTIESGNIAGAIAACSNIWASFPGPGNTYGQSIRPLAVLLSKYEEFLNGTQAIAV